MENMDLERFADLLRRMIEKYAEKIDWDSLPDPPEPSTDEVDGFFYWEISGFYLCFPWKRSIINIYIYTMSKPIRNEEDYEEENKSIYLYESFNINAGGWLFAGCTEGTDKKVCGCI